MDDDKCTLISSNLQTTDFDLWLQKNGVESFVTNNVNSTENCITSLDVDPFLNEICDSTNLDVVSQLECEIMICDSDDNTTCTSPTTNKLLCKQNASFKHEILMNKIPSAISMKIVQEKCIINVKDSEGSTIFLPQVIQVCRFSISRLNSHFTKITSCFRSPTHHKYPKPTKKSPS